MTQGEVKVNLIRGERLVSRARPVKVIKPMLVHWKQQPYDVYIGRPSKYGNPFSHKGATGAICVSNRGEAIWKYYLWLRDNPAKLEEFIGELKGKTLGCWCPPKPCHGDVLICLISGQEVEKQYWYLGEREQDWELFC